MRYFLFRLLLLASLANGMLLAAPILSAATATSTATANIVVPLSVTNTNGLAFGDISVGASAGSVVMGADGSRSADGGAGLVSGSIASAASFTVVGAPGATYSITLPEAATLFDPVGNSMDVGDFTSEHGAVGTLDAEGKQSLAVGATLNVAANQPPGTYSGTFVVTINYN